MLPILRAADVPLTSLLTPPIQSGNALESVVDAILADVLARGDAALYDYTARFDGATLTTLQVTPAEIESAWATESPAFRTTLESAAKNIRAFHEHQRQTGFTLSDQPGIVLGQRVTPLAAVGLYIPGGTASYPSSVLMNAIPALVAGVKRIVITTPPSGDGSIAPAILCAARVAGVTEIYKVGGAQAVAALAYGTQSVPRVDKIVGPGNAYVATAKRRVFGLVDIDMIAGPSEILVIADAHSDPEHVAADLLSQAEHDKLSSAILITTCESLAIRVQAAVERQLQSLPRQAIARASIDQNGRIILVDSLAEAVDLANHIAPEHLELSVDEPFALLGAVTNAGSVFLGRYAPEALGDYWAGLNHTLPTSGTARFSSPLSVDDFVKKTQYMYYARDALRAVKDDVMRFAAREGLTAHAHAIGVRFEEGT